MTLCNFDFLLALIAGYPKIAKFCYGLSFLAVAVFVWITKPHEEMHWNETICFGCKVGDFFESDCSVVEAVSDKFKIASAVWNRKSVLQG